MTMRRAFTLLEILIVVAICIVLLATAGFLLAPAMKTKAMEVRITNDLAQITRGIELYRGDHEGSYPSYMRSLPASVPKRVVPYPYKSAWSLNMPVFQADYFLTYNRGERLRAASATLATKYDPATNSVVKAHFFRRDCGKERVREWYGPQRPGEFFWFDGKCTRVLGGFEDGHVSWVPYLDEWERESMQYPIPRKSKSQRP